MNKYFGMALILITVVAVGVAIRAQRQVRTARAIVSDDLSGNLIRDAPLAAGEPAPVFGASITADVQRCAVLERTVAALQAERDKLQAALTAAQQALAARESTAARPVAPLAPATNALRRVP